jgi:hypothetical protein
MLAFVKEVTKSLKFSHKFEKIKTENEIGKIKITTIFRENVWV